MKITEVRTLSCKLTAEELDKAKTDLSLTCREEEDVTEEKKANGNAFKTRLEEIALKRRSLVGKIESRTEHRPVECEWMFDYKKATKTLVRTDTGEAVQTVTLTERERQTELDVTAAKTAEKEGTEEGTKEPTNLPDARAKRGRNPNGRDS